MLAYVFQAELICFDCGNAYMSNHNQPDHVNMCNEYTYDSGEWPKGPYEEGGGESDTPEHCGRCGVFLHNPLTEDGYEYVAAAFRGFGDVGDFGDPDILVQWASWYGFDNDDISSTREELYSRLPEGYKLPARPR